MIALLVSSIALATSCAAPPASLPAKTPESSLFPEPKSGISIRLEPEKEMRLGDLLVEFSNATGLHLVVNKETAMLLRQATTGLLDSLEIPKSEVYPIVEGLLVQNDFLLTPLTDREPLLFAVSSISQSGQRGASLRNAAVFVPVDEVPAWSRHPAILVTTVINLPSTDVRTLSNSMRTMFTDANTQQIIPVGNSNSLIITGLGAQVASIVAMLQRIDGEARKDMEAAEKKAKESGTPPAPVPQPPK